MSSLTTRGCTVYGVELYRMGKCVPFGFPDQNPPEEPLLGMAEANVDRTLTDQTGSLYAERRTRTFHV